MLFQSSLDLNVSVPSFKVTDAFHLEPTVAVEGTPLIVIVQPVTGLLELFVIFSTVTLP